MELLLKGSLQVATLKYYKDLMKLMLIFLARLETAISRTVIREEAKRQLEKLLAYEKCKSGMSKGYSPNS